MQRIVTEQNLLVGINWWRGNFRQDFHNSLYAELALVKRERTREALWERLVDELGRWGAIRGIRGVTSNHIRDRGLERLPSLLGHYHALLDEYGPHGPDLSIAGWPKLAPLFGVAQDIKPTKTKSPVFPSKLCHFLLPNAFPVKDNEALKSQRRKSYPNYWRFCQQQWLLCPEKDKLAEILKAKIGVPVTPGYPFSAKITELCLIGNSQAQGG